MIENKYKVWCKNNNGWEKDDCLLNQYGDLFQFLTNGRLVPLREDTHTIIIDSGVKDLNDKEAYNGHILKDPECRKRSEREKKSYGVIKKKNNSNNLYLEWNFIKLFEENECWLTNDLPIERVSDYEIVGHILENQELLKECSCHE